MSMADKNDVQCIRKGPLSEEFPEPLTTGNQAGRCTADAEFEVYQNPDPDPARVCYKHLAQTVAAHSPRRPVTVQRFSKWSEDHG